MRKRLLSFVLAVLMFATLLPVTALAYTTYYINGVAVRCDDFDSSPNECWTYANNIYNKIWGQQFNSLFDDSANSLRNLSDSELTLTAEHLKNYVSNAALGSALRICSSEYLHGGDGWGHSQIIVQKDSNGFTVLQGGLSASPYRNERYYTWSEYLNSWNYAYIKYIKWPGAPAYSGGTVPGKPMLLGMKSAYDYRETIIFKWENTESTTHYNLYIDRKQDDGSYTTDYKVYHYVTSGQSVTLPIGEYRVLLQSTNSNAPGQGGTGWAYTNASYVYFAVSNLADPGKPALIEMSGEYDYRENIVFKWNDTVNTTHYNLYIDKKQDDGSYQVDYKVNHYAESGIVLTLPKGEYRVLLQSTNSEYRTDDNSTWRYTNSDYVNFIVKNLADPGKPALLCLSAKYHKMVPILLCWDETINTTHYNIYLDKMNNDGTYQRAQTIHYAENNSTLSLEEGKYRICLQSTNSNYRTDDGNAWRYTDGDWQYFEVSTDNHIWDAGVVTREATERENGICTYTCTLCGDTKEEIIPALPHKHNYDAVVTAPTCTEKGYTTHTCACGDSYVDTYVDALGHAWDNGKVTKEPTETETGTKTFTCTRCGETKTETIPKLTHEHSYKAVVTAPTCTAKGYTTHTCACGDSYVDTYVDALGHAWDNGKVTKEPTATETGIRTYTCTRCSATKTETIPATGSVDVTQMFTDVTKNWAYPGIQYCVTHGIMGGMGDGTFAPTGTTTRAQIVQILYNLEGTPAVSGTTPFTDLTANWYKPAILWAYQNNVVAGTSPTTFDPDQPVTREQIAVILTQYMFHVLKMERTWTPADLSTFPDGAQVSSWAKEAMQDAVALGLINGTKASDGVVYLDPQGSAARQQVATILMNFCQNVKK